MVDRGVEERAVPFRVGEEVLVEIVEPHMYDADDAVAKIDGYIISVRGGGPLVLGPAAHQGADVRFSQGGSGYRHGVSRNR